MIGDDRASARRNRSAARGAFSLRLAAAVLGLLLLAGCAAARPTAAPETTQAVAPRVTELAVAVDGAELAARSAAPLDPSLTIIALHGGPGVSSHYMRDLERFSAHGYRLVTYDQRGVGESELPSPDFTMDAYARDLAAVQDAAAESSVVIFGHSWGGLLALNYAALQPERVRALVLFGSAPPTRSALSRAARLFEARLRELQQGGIVPDPLPQGERYLRALQPVYFSDPTSPLPEPLQQLQYSRRINVRTWAALGNYDYRDRLEALEMPLLFFYGSDDPFGVEMGRATLEALPNASLEEVWLEDCGHYWFECPQPFERELLRFLGDLPAGPTAAGQDGELD